MRLNPRIKGFLLNLIKASGNDQEIRRAEWAITIVNRGIIYDAEMSTLQSIGYKG